MTKINYYWFSKLIISNLARRRLHLWSPFAQRRSGAIRQFLWSFGPPLSKHAEGMAYADGHLPFWAELDVIFYFRPIGPGRGMEKLAEEWFGKKMIWELGCSSLPLFQFLTQFGWDILVCMGQKLATSKNPPLQWFIMVFIRFIYRFVVGIHSWAKDCSNMFLIHSCAILHRISDFPEQDVFWNETDPVKTSGLCVTMWRTPPAFWSSCWLLCSRGAGTAPAGRPTCGGSGGVLVVDMTIENPLVWCCIISIHFLDTAWYDHKVGYRQFLDKAGFRPRKLTLISINVEHQKLGDFLSQNWLVALEGESFKDLWP